MAPGHLLEPEALYRRNREPSYGRKLEPRFPLTSATTVHQMPALPEAEYLVKIGQIAYTVGSIEWLILGELRLTVTG